MITKEQIDKLRKGGKLPITHDLIEVIDALRAYIEEIASHENLYAETYEAIENASRAREFLTRLDAGMLEETNTSDDNIGDIPF